MSEHELFSARLPLCAHIEEQLHRVYKLDRAIIKETVEFLKNHKVYREAVSQNYIHYDLNHKPCDPEAKTKLPHRKLKPSLKLPQTPRTPLTMRKRTSGTLALNSRLHSI